jgi:ABC-type antimicrobial peptide transport system, ATPase component
MTRPLSPSAFSPSAGSPTVDIEGLSHWYGRRDMRRQVLQQVSLRIEPGEVVLLTGPSGCGENHPAHPHRGAASGAGR